VTSSSSPAPLPQLPKANVELQVVATCPVPLMLDVLADGALVYHDQPARDAFLLRDHRIQPQPGLFRSVEVPAEWSVGPVDGSWSGLLTVAIAKRGWMGHAIEAKLFRKSGARWTQLPGELGRHVVNGIAGQSLLVTNDDGAQFFDANGHDQKLGVKTSIDGDAFTIMGASRDDKGRIFVGGFVTEHPKTVDDGGFGLSLASNTWAHGTAVIQRWEPGATSPVVDRMPDPTLAQINQLNGDTVLSSGEHTFAVFGSSRTLAKFRDGRWSVEALPIDPACGVREFTVAKDGTVFFGTTNCSNDAILRRNADGHYDRITLPKDVDHRDIYAESADAVWIVGSHPSGGAESTLYYTRPLGPVIAIP
jgi:hypothetical protein